MGRIRRASESPVSEPRHVHVVIVGSGFGGLGAAIRLKQRGVDDFLILERADSVGGVWRDNSYPGCACDVQSHLFSFSFAPNPRWTHDYSPQAEIWEYLRDCASRFGLTPHLRFGHELLEAEWNDARRRWQLKTSKGAFTADVLVSAMGGLSEPSVPPLPGLDTFEGKVMHSARWDHSHALAGRRVAVVGTGASAIQFVPRIQPEVARLSLFQRTPPWILPRGNRAISARARRLFQRVPAAQWLARAGLFAKHESLLLAFRHPSIMRWVRRHSLRHLERSVPDPLLRARLTPDYQIGCKRVLVSDDYLPSLTQPNVELITDAIQEIRARSILTRAGSEHEVDTIILGTGFVVADHPSSRRIRGRDGRSLAEVFAGSPKAHLGVTVSGFPNLFMLLGPNTSLGHTSVVLMIEAQVEHLLNALDFMRAGGVAAVEPSPEAQASFVAAVDERTLGSVWNQGGCTSWYLDDTGRNSALWPGFTFTYRRRVERFDPGEYLSLPPLLPASTGT
ncbi:flavin-containing monooxygenase [Melittangium boletus]|uniref:4-hydroxyacetophenone monooxygenase n=1 Tax=Melittangium boletus DSM 14713 TaxID=1294270 RepID=A0A286NVD6_9BACT|nr:NAD(P)/FAD-dependent oxidoreductase [Melittangium boletus]ATB27095.1 4-hydroxyacetophenone monooxygenase [Melittangium boletus DSM 14713]